MAKLRSKSILDKFQALHKRALEGYSGFHEQMVGTANILRDHGVHPEEAVKLMHQASESVTRRKPSAGEIERIISWSYQNRGVDRMKIFEQTSHGVKKNQEIINRLASKGSVEELRKRSGRIPKTSEEVLENMYHEDDLLHISPNIFRDDIKTRNEWVKQGLDDSQYLCPCTFKGIEQGRLAKNVDIRKFVVFETDEMGNNLDGQAGLITRLEEELPLKMVAWSGNKSLHAFFNANIPNKKKVKNFHDLVVVLGGDRAVLRAAQMVRCPWGTNTKTGKIQEVIYFK